MSAHGNGALHLAETLLRTLGGRTVLLRLPKPAIAGDLGEQLGLAQPEFQDTELSPAAILRGSGFSGIGEVLLAASAVERVVGSLAFDSAQILFNQAAGIVLDGLLYPIKSLASAEAFGQVYLWRIQLQPALRQGGQA